MLTKENVLNNLSNYGNISLKEIEDIKLNSTIIDYLDKSDMTLIEKLEFDKNYGDYLDDVVFDFPNDVNLEDFLCNIRNNIFLKILYSNIPYKEDMPLEFKEEYRELFLDENAPLELKNLFYNRELTVSDINNNPDYLKYLENVYCQLIKGLKFKSFKVISFFNSKKNTCTLGEKLEFDMYFGDVLDNNDFNDNFKYDFTLYDLYEYAMDKLYKKIIDGACYKEELPYEFKTRYSEFFLDKNAPYYLKNLFYGRNISFSYIKDNPECIVYLSGKYIKKTLLYDKNSYSDVVSFASRYGDLIELVNPFIMYTSDSIHNEFLKMLNGFDEYYIDKLSSEDFDMIAKSLSYVPKLTNYTVRHDLDSNGHSNFYSSDFIMESAIDNGLDVGMFYTGNNKNLIKKILVKKLGKENYNKIFTNINNETFLFDLYSVDDSIIFRKNIYFMFDMNFINTINNHTDWNFFDFLKVVSDDRIKYFVNIISNNKLDDFYSCLSYFTNTSYIKVSSLNDLLNMARFFVHYENLINDIKKDEVLITDNNLSVIKSIYNMEELVEGINSINDLNDFSFRIRVDLINCINDDNCGILDIRNALSKYISGYFYKNKEDNSFITSELSIYIVQNIPLEDKIGISDIFERFINIKTLDDIIKYNNNKELVQYAYEMREFLSFYYDVVMSTTDVDSLKDVGSYLLENYSLVNDVRLYFSDIKEKIKKIYEMEANNNLTQLDNLPYSAKVSSFKYNNDDINFIDLSTSKYAFYAHVITCGDSVEGYVNPLSYGRRIMSVSPITHMGKRLYSEGVTLLYNKIPEGGFIGSSCYNMYSNYYVKNNSLDTRSVESVFYQLPIKDSSANGFYNGNPETLILKDKMVPVGVLIRDEIPSDEECKTALYFQSALGCEFPLIKTQKEGTIAIINNDNNVLDDNFDSATNDLEHLKKIRDILSEKIATDDVYGIYRRYMGGSHNIYLCQISGENGYFLLKPGMTKDNSKIDSYRSYATQCAYEIQKLVNPETSVEAKIVNAPVGPDNLNILCAALKYIPHTINYENWMESDDILSNEDVRWFLKEFICDHLIFNYDNKGANYLKDEDGRNYGIDKEQALKYAVDSRFVNVDRDNKNDFNTELLYDFDPNGFGNIYNKIITDYIEGKQEIDDKIFNECLDICKKVSNMSDREYISYFEDYVNCYCLAFDYNNGLSRLMLDSILARKNNLFADYQVFVSKIKSLRYDKKSAIS